MKAVGHGGVAVTAAEMAFGNKLGVDFTTGNLPLPKYFGNFYGAIIVETAPELAEEYAKQPHTRILGTIGGDVMKVADTEISLEDLLRTYEKTLDPISQGVRKILRELFRLLPKRNRNSALP